MKKLHIPHIFIAILLVMALLLPLRLLAQEPPSAFLVELQTGSSDSASEEFVELFNPAYRTLNIDGWQLQYMPASASQWYAKAELSGHIAPRGRVLIANYQLADEFIEMSGGFAGSGGHVRLLDADELEIDRLAWGSAAEPLGVAAEAHKSGESLKRQTDEDGKFVDNRNNGADWFVSTQPSPEHIPWQPPIQEETETEVSEGEKEAKDQEQPSSKSGDSPKTEQKKQAGQTSAEESSQNVVPEFPIHITEVFPDPGSPLTDSEDEFVELYNPNDFSVDLTGYKIESGKSFYSSQTLQSVSIQPHRYLAFRSSEIELSLSNSGAVVRLVGSRGTELSFIQAPKAKTDMAWAQTDQTWQWLSPSPGKENVAQDNESGEMQTTSVSSASGGDGESFGSGAQENLDKRHQYEPAKEQHVEPINVSILAGVGSLAVLYALYEYRHDIGNRIQQFRRYLAHRRKNRPKASRRGVSGA